MYNYIIYAILIACVLHTPYYNKTTHYTVAQTVNCQPKSFTNIEVRSLKNKYKDKILPNSRNKLKYIEVK